MFYAKLTPSKTEEDNKYTLEIFGECDKKKKPKGISEELINLAAGEPTDEFSILCALSENEFIPVSDKFFYKSGAKLKDLIS